MKFAVFACLVMLSSCMNMNAYDGGSGFSGETVEIERVFEVEGSGIDLTEVVDGIIEKNMKGRHRRDTDEEDATDEPTTTAVPTPTLPSLATTTTQAPAATNKTCTLLAVCEDNDDCNGGTCVGAFVGKCNCNACLNFIGCSNDAACGGLEGACNNKTKLCDCNAALAKHGYATFFNALQKFCNIKTCKANECNGLKCNKGFCTCPAKKN